MLGWIMQLGAQRNSYTYETKLKAVEDHLDRGMTASDAMLSHGVASKSAFFRRCAAYRDGGAQALRPKKRGRPRKNA